jgi:hypothetical protein
MFAETVPWPGLAESILGPGVIGLGGAEEKLEPRSARRKSAEGAETSGAPVHFGFALRHGTGLAKVDPSEGAFQVSAKKSLELFSGTARRPCEAPNVQMDEMR